MGLSLDDTSIAKYYKKLGIEEGKAEGRAEVAVKMLCKGVELEHYCGNNRFYKR